MRDDELLLAAPRCVYCVVNLPIDAPPVLQPCGMSSATTVYWVAAGSVPNATVVVPFTVLTESDPTGGPIPAVGSSASCSVAAKLVTVTTTFASGTPVALFAGDTRVGGASASVGHNVGYGVGEAGDEPLHAANDEAVTSSAPTESERSNGDMRRAFVLGEARYCKPIAASPNASAFHVVPSVKIAAAGTHNADATPSP